VTQTATHTNQTTVKRSSAVRTPEVAVGALIIAACVVGAMTWGRSAVVGTPVLVVTSDVKRGQVLRASDFGTITLTSSDDIELVRASSVDDAVGLRATVDIDAGTPLTPAQLSAVSPLPAGRGLVGLTVVPGEAPAELNVGDSVRVLVPAAFFDFKESYDSKLDGKPILLSPVELIESGADFQIGRYKLLYAD